MLQQNSHDQKNKLFDRNRRLWLKAVTEPNSDKPTAIAEWERAESTGKYGNVRVSDTGI